MKTIRLMIVLAVAFITTTTISRAQTVYYPKLQSMDGGMDKAKTDIAETLKKSEYLVYHKLNLMIPPKNKDILVLDDKIEVKGRNKRENTTVNFSDILDYPIVVTKVLHNNGDIIYFSAYPIPENQDYFLFSDVNMAMKVADYLFFFQHKLNEKRYSSQLVLFEPIAAQYRALKVKPPVSEEQRKYIVQANSFNQQKQYDNAIELYIKAIEMDQTAYPAAYSNLALMSAQINKISAAIYYMKKYLLLEPDAADARSAQDKIYEWEARISR